MILAGPAFPRDLPFLAGTLIAAAGVTPIAMKLALKVGLVDRPGPNKFHGQPTPYLGGLAIAASVLAALAGAIVVYPELRLEFVAIALGGGAVAAVGLLDDWSTLSPAPRLAVQALAALGLWAVGIRVAPTGFAPVDIGLTILVVWAVTNATNLLDNMDGLSSGTAAIASLFFFVAAHWEGQRLVSLMAIMLAGACLGFLPHNFSPARIFLGDAGALFIGFLLAVLAIKLKLDGYPPITRAVVPMAIIAVPLFDMTLVVFSRWRGGRPVFRGGTDHSSHRLVALGVSPAAAALITYAAGLLTGGTALLLLWANNPRLSWEVAGLGVVGALLLVARLERVHLPRFARSREPDLSPSPARPALVPAELSPADLTQG